MTSQKKTLGFFSAYEGLFQAFLNWKESSETVDIHRSLSSGLFLRNKNILKTSTKMFTLSNKISFEQSV